MKIKRYPFIRKINGRIRIGNKLFGKAFIRFHNEYCLACITSFGEQDCRYWSFAYPPQDKLPKVGETWVWRYNGQVIMEYKIIKIVNKKWPKVICQDGSQIILNHVAWKDFRKQII